MFTFKFMDLRFESLTDTFLHLKLFFNTIFIPLLKPVELDFHMFGGQWNDAELMANSCSIMRIRPP